MGSRLIECGERIGQGGHDDVQRLLILRQRRREELEVDEVLEAAAILLGLPWPRVVTGFWRPGRCIRNSMKDIRLSLVISVIRP